MMVEENLFLLFCARLEDLRATYMVTGSVAGIIYGEPRLTHDVDIVLVLETDQVAELCAAFPVQEFYCPPSEVIRVEAARSSRGHFNIIHHETGFKADIYLAHDALHRWALGRRQRLELPATQIWVAPPEYVIVRKLEYYREGGAQKHLADIRAILRVSHETIDRRELERLVAQQRVEKEWRTVLA